MLKKITFVMLPALMFAGALQSDPPKPCGRRFFLITNYEKENNKTKQQKIQKENQKLQKEKRKLKEEIKKLKNLAK